MESHSEEALRKAGLFQGGTEMKNPTSGTLTGLLSFKLQPADTYPMGRCQIPIFIFLNLVL